MGACCFTLITFLLGDLGWLRTSVFLSKLILYIYMMDDIRYFNSDIYIYIYICVCVCVCVCIISVLAIRQDIYLYIYISHQANKRCKAIVIDSPMILYWCIYWSISITIFLSIHLSIYIDGLVWFRSVWFYGISNFVGYLTLSPLLCKQSVLFQTI